MQSSPSHKELTVRFSLSPEFVVTGISQRRSKHTVTAAPHSQQTSVRHKHTRLEGCRLLFFLFHFPRKLVSHDVSRGARLTRAHPSWGRRGCLRVTPRVITLAQPSRKAGDRRRVTSLDLAPAVSEPPSDRVSFVRSEAVSRREGRGKYKAAAFLLASRASS